MKTEITKKELAIDKATISACIVVMFPRVFVRTIITTNALRNNIMFFKGLFISEKFISFIFSRPYYSNIILR